MRDNICKNDYIGILIESEKVRNPHKTYPIHCLRSQRLIGDTISLRTDAHILVKKIQHADTICKRLMKPIAPLGRNQTIYATDLAGSMLSASTNNISATTLVMCSVKVAA